MLWSVVKPNTYQDSLRLLHLSKTLESLEGVHRVSVMMGTPANIEMFRAAGLGTPDLDRARPTDLVIVVDAEDAATGASLVERVDAFLLTQTAALSRSGVRSVRSLERALSVGGDLNLALVSIPGSYVPSEARSLLDRGLHVFIFSDNVSVEDEVALKRQARESGLLVMGPDCGTGSLGGLPLAFTNAIHEGSIGLVGASGTGLQEVMVQIDRLGGGVSHAIGLGGRDLSAEVGGVTCLQALQALDADPATAVIALVSKPPAPSVRDEVIRVADGLSKPVVAVLLGDSPEVRVRGNVHSAWTLEEAARVAVEVAGTRSSRAVVLRPEQRWIKALYTGGSLAAEAAMILGAALGPSENAGSSDGVLLRSGGHEVIDLGHDTFTRGRPHPMIDPSVRAERIPAVFDDEESAVLLLDVVLGYGCDADPAGALAPVIADGLDRVHAEGRDLAVVASLCGTEGDPQVMSAQTRTLVRAGVSVLPSNVAAVRHALAILRRREASRTAPEDVPEPIRRLLSGPPRILNVGLRAFAETLHERGAHVVHYDWRPVASGDPRLQSLLDALK